MITRLLLAGLLLLASAVMGCRPAPRTDQRPDVMAEAKFDAPLRRALRVAAPDERLQYLLQLGDAATPAHREAIETDGLQVLAVVDSIVTAQGPPPAVRRAARHDFVRAVFLSETRAPSHR